VALAVEPPGVGPSPDMLWAQPNPFTDAASIRFLLPKAGPATVSIYDASGRRVANLAQGEKYWE